ncbi:alpha/beta fold hydrolase [Nocardioides sp. W7]|uniref:alpha/beta fold hydrolase n=1 Tax=Nocardioides sp. W7 TaxID=2931390 RepID=UPI001FD40572|nr:alpha/beta fold hydrolase [Nocardioides sp. W7]
MDLIPTRDQVVSAASNLAQQLVHGSIADLRPMPRTLLEEGDQRQLYHYRPSASAPRRGDPVLLVSPLAAPAICFDLRRGCSLVEHLVEQGRPTYLVEYGDVDVRDRDLGLAHWVDEVVPRAVEAASTHAGGRPVHVVGWSLGGILALLTAADRPGLPIASVTAAGSPTDISQVPLVAPVRPMRGLDEGDGLIGRTYRAVGGVPVPLVRWAFQLSTFQKLVSRPLAIAANLDDTEFLAQLEAVDRFTDDMTAYPGRTFGQVYHRFVTGNALVGGAMQLGSREISLSAITAPVLVLAGATDTIAPVAAVREVLQHLSGSLEPRFEIVPGGHLGMLTGRAARTSTWAVLDEWIDEWSDVVPPKKAVRKRAAATKAPASKQAATARKTPAKKAAPRRKAATQESIGSNPTRRYGSGDSRALGR